MTPTARTLAFLRSDLGMQAGVVEKWNPHARIRQDLFGFADLIACSPAHGIVAIQATSGDNVSKRIAKIRNEPRAVRWLESHGRIWVVGWSKKGPRGKRKLWTPRIVEILRADEVEVEEGRAA